MKKRIANLEKQLSNNKQPLESVLRDDNEDVDLIDRVALLEDENKALKITLREHQDNNDREIAIYQDLLEQQKKHFKSYIKEMKNRLEEKGSSIPSMSEKQHKDETDSKLEEILSENEKLKKEIDEYKKRCNSLAMRLQNKK